MNSSNKEDKKKILKDGIVPAELIFTSKYYLKEMINVNPPGGIYTHICGTDIIRHSDGEYYVLEDMFIPSVFTSYFLMGF